MARNLVDRIDGLPEQTIYHDDGCGHGCVRSLECPFPACRYDVPGVWQQGPRDERARRVLDLHRARKMTVDQIAREVGTSRRTVHRILSEERRRGLPQPSATSCNEDD